MSELTAAGRALLSAARYGAAVARADGTLVGEHRTHAMGAAVLRTCPHLQGVELDANHVAAFWRGYAEAHRALYPRRNDADETLHAQILG